MCVRVRVSFGKVLGVRTIESVLFDWLASSSVLCRARTRSHISFREQEWLEWWWVLLHCAYCLCCTVLCGCVAPVYGALCLCALCIAIQYWFTRRASSYGPTLVSVGLRFTNEGTSSLTDIKVRILIVYLTCLYSYANAFAVHVSSPARPVCRHGSLHTLTHARTTGVQQVP